MPFGSPTIACRRYKSTPPRAVTACQAKRHPSCMSPRHLLGSSCFDGLPLLFIGVVKPFSYALLSHFRPRPPALLQPFLSSYLTSGHQMSRLSFRLCARRRASSYNRFSAVPLGHRPAFPYDAAWSVAGKNSHSSSLFFPFFGPVAYPVPRVSLPFDKYTLARLRRESNFLAPSFRFIFVCLRPRATDRRPLEPTSHQSSSVPQTHTLSCSFLFLPV